MTNSNNFSLQSFFYDTYFDVYFSHSETNLAAKRTPADRDSPISSTGLHTKSRPDVSLRQPPRASTSGCLSQTENLSVLSMSRNWVIMGQNSDLMSHTKCPDILAALHDIYQTGYVLKRLSSGVPHPRQLSTKTSHRDTSHHCCV